MKKLYQVVVNNYQLGAKVKSMPIEKVVEQVRIDSAHTKFTFANLTVFDKDLIKSLVNKNPEFIGFKR